MTCVEWDVKPLTTTTLQTMSQYILCAIDAYCTGRGRICCTYNLMAQLLMCGTTD